MEAEGRPRNARSLLTRSHGTLSTGDSYDCSLEPKPREHCYVESVRMRDAAL